MLEPPISNLGVKGIRKAIAETRRWPDRLDEEGLRRACFTIALFIDHRGGSGGGIFRYLYGRFLVEAATVAGEPALAPLGARFESIGDAWEQVAAAFAGAAEADDPAACLGPATEPMVDIAAAEEEVWEQLRALIG